MFNRNNLPSVPNPFGGRESSPRPPRDPYSQAPQQPPRSGYDTVSGGYGSRRGGDYDTNMEDYEAPRSQRNMPSRPTGNTGRPSPRASGQRWQLELQKGPPKMTFMNLVAVSPFDFPPTPDGTDIMLLLQGQYVVSARPTEGFPAGAISLSDPQRTWMGIALTDRVDVQLYDPFSQGKQAYLGSMDVEIGFASKTKKTETPYDQDELMKVITQSWQNQVLQPGQRMIFDLRSIPLMLVVKTVQLMDLSEKPSSAPTSSDPRSKASSPLTHKSTSSKTLRRLSP